MESPVAHPALITLLLTIAALGAPLAYTANSIAMGCCDCAVAATDGASISQDSVIECAARSSGSLALSLTCRTTAAEPTKTAWASRSVDSCHAAAPPPTLLA